MMKQPFQIDVENVVLEDLARRLRRTRWLNSPGDDGWELGTNPSYLRDLMTYWIHGYDWRAQEARLNEMPQFMANVGVDRIHFLHQRSQGPHAMPLLLLHGWPDSFLRYYKVIPMLTAPADHGADAEDACDVVVPSLPGFAFTGPVKRRPSKQPTRHAAQLLWRLMTEILGYDRFVVAGGDGGSVLAQVMAIDHPESVMAIHVTDLGWHVATVDPSALSKTEQKYLEAGQKHFMKDGGYAAMQATKPYSLAPSLNDSPTGLAAWIVDRFHSWCDCDGDIERSFTKDELLTNIMLYWITGTIGSSMANYHDDAVSPSLTPADHVDVPVGVALFPKDIGGIPPRAFAERTLNVQRWTEMPRGSHFAALEEPELFAHDLSAFVRTIRMAGREVPQGAAT